MCIYNGGKPEPLFEELGNGLMVTLYKGTASLPTDKIVENVVENVTENRSRQIIGLIKENCRISTSDGKKYKTKLYNLDVIISVGYIV